MTLPINANRLTRLLGTALALCFALPITAQAQFGTGGESSASLNLAPDSPYRDPDIIYLEADELINNEANGILIAKGEVEGRYQDKTLRADEVIYTLRTGEVVATGNVILIGDDGSSQYADKLDLSSELETGTASNFTSRMPNGGVTGAAFATRRTDQGFELYNAYYTACEPCQGKKPTWQIKARRVSQDKENKMIRYKDAVFEAWGIPFFYLPYMAHPDPTAGRTSGWLSPFIGVSNSKGVNFRAPYYWAIDPYSELTVTPRLFQKVNPVLGYEYRRKFYSGEVNVEGSLTYASAFDRSGDPFTSADTFTFNIAGDEAPTGKRLRSHVFATGLFKVDEDWDWGFGVQAASDDLYLNRYDFDETPEKFGLYQSDSRRLISQLFTVGQDENFRFVAGTYGFQSLRTRITETAPDSNDFRVNREDDGVLPIIAPKIELTRYFKDPILDGRLKAFGDVAVLSRKEGNNYTKATGGVDWQKTFITPGGIEAKPFGQFRYDFYEHDIENGPKSDFSRTLGQAGMDIRWPFIKSGKDVNFIIEPRAMVTQNFGNGKTGQFSTVDNNGTTISLFEDSQDIDLDQSIFWSANKSTGYDFWQKGLRADVGGSVAALWGDNRTSLFLGKSYVSDYTDSFGFNSGLSGDNSDLVGQFELELGRAFKFSTQARYDDNNDIFRRIDTGFNYRGKRLRADARYYRINSANPVINAGILSPTEEISGSVSFKINDNWSTRYRAYHDIDADVTRIQEIGLMYKDCCTSVELVYNERNFENDAVRNSSGFGIRVSLVTLGDFEPE